MPPKAKIAAPIDRPLSRAYLREFTGWSPAYPPGLSDPTSLRVMENIQIARDGSARIRPGLRFLTYDDTGLLAYDGELVGSHETFFLNDGSKALLFAVRETQGDVGFRVAKQTVGATPEYQVYGLTDDEIGFDIPQGEDFLYLSADTTYVKYLQIDNKVFALGNAGDELRIFHVGVAKKAETVVSIDRPNWNTADKLSVIHPEALWITAGTSNIVRTNLFTDPSFERSTDASSSEWELFSATYDIVTTGTPATGSNHLKITGSGGQGVFSRFIEVEPGKDYELSAMLKRGADSCRIDMQVDWFKHADGSGGLLRTDTKRTVGLTTTHKRYRSGIWTAPATAHGVRIWYKLAPGEAAGTVFYVDDLLWEQTSEANKPYFSGATADAGGFDYQWSGATNDSISYAYESVAEPTTIPTAETKTTQTLISSNDNDNVYSFGFFYNFYNEVGESAASQVRIVRAQQPWSGWNWETPNLAGEPSGTETEDPEECADQLVAIMPQEVFDSAMDLDAKGWNLYMFTWSDQDSVPVEAFLVGSRELDEDSVYGSHGWIRVTPETAGIIYTAPLPNGGTRINYSEPSRASQGVVAADRIILVNDPTAGAVIRWSSNNQGDYTNFTASRGGGYKTLTSGELMIAACVKLWQNPQSADTLTILCMGVDGYSTGYYMQPAQVAQQSEAVNLMGFEETTATPGTVSPYGVEVLNNTLYHPLDNQLMKSTASNYNINHKSVTDQIENKWTGLVNKDNIVAAQHENRLYYIVHNPEGEALAEGCMGNEVWVFDAQAENGHWSRWTVQGSSLRTLEVGGRVYMSITRPEGLFIFDPAYDRDDFVDVDFTVDQRFIPWSLETNTQGANRAHDAPCHLQQANTTLGNFAGTLKLGIRGRTIHGKEIVVEKLVRDDRPVSAETLPFDLEDKLLIRQDLIEWHYFASSVTDELDAVEYSTGQLNLVQYRYTPVTVNVGYEFGSIETFEYGRSGNAAAQRTVDNGIPQPMLNTTRP